MRLGGRRALVTGASRGIGRAVARKLAEDGCDIVFSYYRSESEALAFEREIVQSGRRALAVKADVSDEKEVAFLCQKAVEYLGGMDILVNCAGMMQQCPLDELPLKEWEKVMSTNVTSAFMVIKNCLPALRKSSFGRIINISSQAAFTGSRNRAAYSASKAALLGLTYSLAKELGPEGITVNAVSPGRIVTDMIREDMQTREQEWIEATPLRRLGEPEETASMAAFLAGDEASYITGANMNVNGGILMG